LLPGERQVSRTRWASSGANDHGGAEFPAAFGTLGSQQMALARVHAEDLAASGDLETLGDRLLCLDTFGATHNQPGDLICLVTILERTFDDDEEDPADEEGYGDRPDRFGQGEAASFQEQSADAGDAEGARQFEEIVAAGGVVPAVGKLPEAFGEQGQDGEDSPCLDDDIEEVTLG
jgi:hypothetical protein